ncbi:MAG: hypothetical protein M3Y88_08675, partial [Chloroflexota bacterium]|nr:hypothetical protein [Chloroflexota bacterium]
MRRSSQTTAGRRARLILLAVAFVATAVLVAVLATRGHPRSAWCGDLGPADGFNPDSVSRVDCIPAYVVRIGAAPPIVYLARSPHLKNERLDWNAERRLFVSPLHGETFDIQGRVVSAPAFRNLWRCPSTVR